MKCILEQIPRIRVNIRTMCPQYNADQLHIPIICHGDQCRQGIGRIPRLSCHGIFVVVLIHIDQHLMMLGKYMLLCRIRCRDRITLFLAYLQKFRISPNLPADQCHISRTCIMILIMKTIRIDKIRILSTQFLAFLIHLLNEPVIILSRILSYIFRNCVSCFIRGCQKRRIQGLFQRDHIAFF